MSADGISIGVVSGSATRAYETRVGVIETSWINVKVTNNNGLKTVIQKLEAL